MNLFEVSKRFTFEAAHRLPHLPEGHKCRNLHGHSYTIEVFCKGGLDGRGFVIDYAEITQHVKPIIEQLDHSFICSINEDIPQNIDVKVARLDIPWTSAEYLALWLHDTLKPLLKGLSSVVVYETATTSVRYPV